MRRLRTALGTTWTTWDDTTGVPRRLLTSGTPAPDTTANPWEAARLAKQLLADHIDAVAPGSRATDFVLVSNHESAGMRSIGFRQFNEGREVLGGQVSFRFSHDRLVAIGSEALPFVVAPSPTRRIDEDTVQQAASDWLDATVLGHETRTSEVTGPFVLPVLDPDETRPRYFEVFAVDVRLEQPDSAWRVYIDSETGDPVAREQTLTFAAGNVLYNVPTRSPSFGPRADFFASNTDLLVDGAPQLTDAQGTVSFLNATALVNTALEGPLQTLVDASGEVASAALFIGDGGTTTWNAQDSETVDAQLTAFIHAGVVKEYVRGIDPTFAFLDQQLRVTVNIDDECNAFSDGDSINFFLAGDSCENTGRIADVVYHEYGHSVHTQSIIPGVGVFDGSLSEGVSDYLSATMTNDSGLARGFFYNDQPLREIDPDGLEYVWPQDAGEVHDAGRIIAGALWDLRKALIAKHGDAQGVRIADRIYYEATRRAVDIPSMHPEALLVDDDDGDLSNGTPNGCEINAAFGVHGLFSSGEGSEAVTLNEGADGLRVDLQLALPSFPQCPVSAAANVSYRVRGTTEETTIAMTTAGGGYTALIPPQAVGQVIQYQVAVDYSVGAQHSLPDNRADPWYEVFIGPVDTLYCTSFTGEAAEAWSNGSGFEVGAPAGNGSPVDPPSAYDNDGAVLGHSLNGNGFYNAWSTDSVQGPSITFDPTGYSSVHLQYQRWLSIEDGVFDQASIEVDGATVWSNFVSDNEEQATTHHTDREWRFHDIDITQQAADGEVTLGFQLASDGGLELGGWTIDALCIVGVGHVDPVCGNGIVEGNEACDDANEVEGDGCSTACTTDDAPPGGSGGPDGSDNEDDEGDDNGGGDPSGGLASENGLIDRGCACAAGPSGGPGPALWLLGIGLLGLRRRAR